MKGWKVTDCFTFICARYQNTVSEGHNALGGKCASGVASTPLASRSQPTNGTNLQTFLRLPCDLSLPRLEDRHHGDLTSDQCHLRPFYPVYDIAGKQTRNNTFFKLNDLSYKRIHLSSNTRCFLDYLHSEFNFYIYVFT